MGRARTRKQLTDYKATLEELKIDFEESYMPK